MRSREEGPGGARTSKEEPSINNQEYEEESGLCRGSVLCMYVFLPRVKQYIFGKLPETNRELPE